MTPLVLVVDASVAVKLYLIESLKPETDALFRCLKDPGAVFHVPDLFYAECANILWKQVGKGNSNAIAAAAHMTDLTNLPLHSTDSKDLCGQALDLALKHNISAYDACYVALAQQEGVELITADQKLVTKLAGITPAVVWLGSWKPPAGAAAAGT
jgi:predicted nucleic acid-binding protein